MFTSRHVPRVTNIRSRCAHLPSAALDKTRGCRVQLLPISAIIKAVARAARDMRVHARFHAPCSRDRVGRYRGTGQSWKEREIALSIGARYGLISRLLSLERSEIFRNSRGVSRFCD